jgi:hypothetical protein
VCRRVKNLAPEQIERKRASDRVKNMTPERIERKRASDRVENMAPEQIERKRIRNRVENMTEEQAQRKRARARERYRNLGGDEYNRLLLRNRRRKALARRQSGADACRVERRTCYEAQRDRPTAFLLDHFRDP